MPSYAELVRNGGDAAGAAGAPARAAEAALARGGPIALCAASITVRDSAFTPLLRRATSLLATLSSMAARRAHRRSRRAACTCARTRSSSRGSTVEWRRTARATKNDASWICYGLSYGILRACGTDRYVWPLSSCPRLAPPCSLAWVMGDEEDTMVRLSYLEGDRRQNGFVFIL